MSFLLLKRTYPISKFDRFCDGYDYIIKNTTEEERNSLNIEINKLQKIIKKGEQYIYQVAKENDEFKIMTLSFSNFKIIRNILYMFEINDENEY